ncbi:MAG: acyltransferase [Cyanobacteria bacterium J06626_23]
MQGTINSPPLNNVWQRWRSRLAVQIRHVWIHLINGVSNFLGNDILSCWLRKQLLRLLGMQLGRGTVIRGGSYLYGGRLQTGIGCQVNRSCYFDFTGPITFGDRVVVGHGVTFVTAKHRMGGADCRAGKDITGQPITLESGVWIGANATLLPGVTIHRGAVVAAGAVVTKNVPPNTVAAGVPARVIRQLGAEGIGGASTSDVLKSNVLQEAPL